MIPFPLSLINFTLVFTRDYYELLKIAPDSSESEIRNAYRKRSKELHPDVNSEPTAAADFAELSSAFRVLLDPVQRLKHDDYFRLNTGIRNQDRNIKQQFSNYQRQKAASTVSEWSNDYEKAMQMRDSQRNNLILHHRKRMKLVLITAIACLILSLAAGILFYISSNSGN